jgi:outer membrane protein TolC
MTGAFSQNRVGQCAWIILAGICQALAQSSDPPAHEQTQQPGSVPNTALGPVPAVLTFRDALVRAQNYEPQFLAAVNAANLAHEDTVQARAALYPTLGARSDYLNTQGNGKLPSGIGMSPTMVSMSTVNGEHSIRTFQPVRCHE